MNEACPYCRHEDSGHAIAHAAGVSLAPPTPSAGDVSVCGSCGAIRVFSADLKLEKPSYAQLIRIKKDRRAWAELWRIREAIGREAKR